MSAQKNISHIPEDKLMAYLEGKLAPDEQREIEALLEDEGMESDALEGLQELQSNETRLLAQKINYKLQNDLRKSRRTRRNHFADNKWSWIAVLVILLLVVLGFVLIKLNG